MKRAIVDKVEILEFYLGFEKFNGGEVHVWGHEVIDKYPGGLKVNAS